MPDFSKTIVYKVDAIDDVAVKSDIVYKQDSAAKMLMDVYAPPNLPREARLPVVLFVHGGPIPADMPAPKTWGIFRSYGQLVATSGMVGVTFNHRLHAIADFGRSQVDIAAAIDYVRTHADGFNIDAERIGAWYFSGGGPQLSWVLREKPSYVRCVAAFYAMLDVRHLVPPDASPESAASWKGLSASSYLKKNETDLPIFIARAGLDTEMVNKGVDLFVREALAANASLELMNHAQGQHGFDYLDDDKRSREIIARAIAFFQSHL